MRDALLVSNHKIIVDMEGERYLAYYATIDEMLHEASRMMAFNDCEPFDSMTVTSYDSEWHYMGWQPGMKYEWEDDNGRTWVGYYPEWDH